jgi:hypothetical protein
MSPLDKRHVQVPDVYSKHTAPFAVGDPVRRVGKSADFWNDTILTISLDHMTILYEDNTDPIDLVRCTVMTLMTKSPTGFLGVSSSSRVSRPRKPATKAEQKYDWSIDKITKIFVKPANTAIISVASRTTLVFNSNLLGSRYAPAGSLLGTLARDAPASPS